MNGLESIRNVLLYCAALDETLASEFQEAMDFLAKLDGCLSLECHKVDRQYDLDFLVDNLIGEEISPYCVEIIPFLARRNLQAKFASGQIVREKDAEDEDWGVGKVLPEYIYKILDDSVADLIHFFM